MAQASVPSGTEALSEERSIPTILTTAVIDSLALQPGRNLPDDIRRLANDLVDRTLHHLHQADGGLDESIHETRKRLKEFRSLLRLVRFEIGEIPFHTENIRLRDSSRLVAPVRDSVILLEKLEAIRSEETFHISPVPLLELRNRLEIRHMEIAFALARSTLLPEVERTIRTATVRIALWNMEHTGFSGIGRGLKEVYRDGLRSMVDARFNPTDDLLHEWRKNGKYLWHHVRMLSQSWPGPLTSLATALHTLSNRLGDDHDLALLAMVIRRDRTMCPPEIQDALLRVIDRQRQKLQGEAWRIGQRIYAERPREFVRRMETYWKEGRRDGREDQIGEGGD